MFLDNNKNCKDMSETHILLRSVTCNRNIWALNFEIPVPKNLIVSGYIVLFNQMLHSKPEGS